MPKIIPVPGSIINPPETDQEVVNTRYYRFTECCTGTVTYLAVYKLTSPLIPNGVYIFEGNGVSGDVLGYEPIDDVYIPLVRGNCYQTELLLVDESQPLNTGAEYATLYEAAVFITSNYTEVGDETTDCSTPAVVDACPDCESICYVFITCDGLVYTTSNDLSAYVGQSVTGVFVDDPILDPTCGQVGIAPNGYSCIKSTNIVIDPETPCTCDCICYSVTGAAQSLLYVDCEGNIVQENLLSGTYGPFCSRTYPALIYSDQDNPPIVYDNGLCEDGDFDGVYECPTNCYLLTDCDGIEDPITTNSNLYTHLVQGHIVKIEGSNSCWTVSTAEDCSCAVVVSVLQYYDSCKTCKNPVNYKLTNCDTNEVIYTSSDLSAYVGKTIVRNECPGCWFVEQLDTEIPSDVIVTVAASFDDCELCGLTYYSLTNCEDLENVIYTSEDLSAYVGQVITLKWCPNICWTVAETQAPGTTTFVLPENSYQTCDACIRAKTCICVRVQNITLKTYDFQYYDCSDANARQTLQIAPNSFSEKLCVSSYTVTADISIREYGDCIDGACPVQDDPKPVVKPGYTSKTCNDDYFLEVTCSYSERIYKEVMSLRYGISNCCDDLTETYKLEIKKAILDLDVINDPDYECNTSSTCGCNTTITYTTNCNS